MAVSTTKIEGVVLGKIAEIKKNLKQPNVSQTINFLCDFYTFFDSDAEKNTFNKLPEAVVISIDSIMKDAPSIGEHQLRKMYEVLDEYARKKNIRVART